MPTKSEDVPIWLAHIANNNLATIFVPIWLADAANKPIRF
jgi:hypothetical protein